MKDCDFNLLEQLENNPLDNTVYRIKNKKGKWEGVKKSSFLHEIKSVARKLKDIGVDKGDRIAICADTGYEWLIHEMAGWLVGAVIVGIEPFATEEKINHIVKIANVQFILTDTKENLNKIPFHFRHGIKHVITFEQLKQRVLSVNSISNNYSINIDDPALLIFTSGTTGDSKGILYSHKQLMVGCEAIKNVFPETGGGHRIICWLPMAHLFQQVMNLLCLKMGIELFFIDDPRKIMDYIKEIKPTIFIGIPRLYEKIYDGINQKIEGLPPWLNRILNYSIKKNFEFKNKTRQFEAISLSMHFKALITDFIFLKKIRRVMGGCIKYMITGSAPLSSSIMEFYHTIGLNLYESYGLSENTVPISCNSAESYKIGSVGKPLMENDLKFANDGEILVKGNGMFDGYFKQQETSGLTSDGYYLTGDLGFQDEEGYLFINGRKSELIKTSTGRRISPNKVESVFMKSTLIDQIIVVGNRRKQLAALIVPNQELSKPENLETLIKTEVEEFNKRLPIYEQIKKFTILDKAFSVNTGEMTSSLKYRRQFIEDKYQTEIDQMFDEPKIKTEKQKDDSNILTQKDLKSKLSKALKIKDAHLKRLEKERKRKEQFNFKVEIADNYEDLCAAFQLVHNQYVSYGYENPDSSGLRVNFHNLLPTSYTFVAKENDIVVGTLTVIKDTIAGLPMDDLYQYELDSLRLKTGRVLSELSSLAVSPTSNNSKGYLILSALFIRAFLLCYDILKISDFCITVNPRHMRYYTKLLNFSEFGDIKEYDKVNGAPAVPLRLDLDEAEKMLSLTSPQLHESLVMSRKTSRSDIIKEVRSRGKFLSTGEYFHRITSQTNVLDNLEKEQLIMLSKYYPTREKSGKLIKKI